MQYHLKNTFMYLLGLMAILGFASVSYGLDKNLLKVMQDRDVAGVKYFLESNPSYAIVMQADADGWTALHVASSLGYDEIVGLLLDCNSSLEFLLKKDNENRWTALHVACWKGHVEVVKLLLRDKSHFDLLTQPTFDGWTALHIASYKGHKKVVELLLLECESASLVFLLSQQTSDNGLIPLDIACYHGHLAIVEYLVSKAPFLLSQRDSGNVALDIAVESKKYNVAHYVVKKMRELGVFLNLHYSLLTVLEASLQKVVFLRLYEIELTKNLQNKDLDFKLLNVKIDEAQKIYNIFFCKSLLNKKKFEILELKAQELTFSSVAEECLQIIQRLQNVDLELKHLHMQKDEMQTTHNIIFFEWLLNQNNLKFLEAEIEQLKHQWLAMLAQKRNKPVALNTPQDAKQNVMEDFYKDLTKEDIIDVLNILREQRAVDENSIDWINGIIDFFKTGEKPTAWSLHPSFLEHRALKRMKASDEPVIVEVRSHNLAISGNKTRHYMLLDAYGNITEDHEITDAINTPFQCVGLHALRETLRAQARNSPYEIAFGRVGLFSMPKNKDENYAAVHHQFVYFARRNIVYFIDFQNTAQVLVESIHDWKTGARGNLEPILGDCALIVPMMGP